MLSQGDQSPDNQSPDNQSPDNLHPDDAFQCDQQTFWLPGSLYLWPTERSYTRQPLAEWHTIGSWPLLELATEAFCRHGARPAEPGEFTLRAFLAGRLDLTQAEAVLGVIDARDRRDFQVALSQLAGGLRGLLSDLRGNLLDLLAELEAGLDFVEEDIEFISSEDLLLRLQRAQRSIDQLAQQAQTRLTSAPTVQVVLTGEPNVGKSSLFNAFADFLRTASEKPRPDPRSPSDRPASSLSRALPALVSDRPGTTRDYLTHKVSLEGLECLLVDTAGREAITPQEVLDAGVVAQQHSERQVAQAQVVLRCMDSSRVPSAEQLQQLQGDSGSLLVLTKADCPDVVSVYLPPQQRATAIRTSAASGEGLAELRLAIAQAAMAVQSSEGGSVVGSTATRCRDSLRRADQHLTTAVKLVQTSGGEELIAAELRLALTELGKVIGVVYTDDILDRIFSRFCIGK